MAEDMEIDHIVDVPDTPDRFNPGHNDRKYRGNPEKRERAFLVADEMTNNRKYITVSPSDKPYPSQNAPIFRKSRSENVFGLGMTHSNGVDKMEKGKTVSSKFTSKSSHHGPVSVLDLTEESRQFQQQNPPFSPWVSRDNATGDKKELKASIGNSSVPVKDDSSNTSRNASTGKCTLDNKTLPGPNISVDRGKSISLSNDSQYQSKTEKLAPLPPRFSTIPNGRGHKRLVRHGCISPLNIATRAKQSVEQSSLQTNVKQNHAEDSVSSSTMSPICIDDIVSEERGNGRRKGKEVLIHPSSHSHGLNAGNIHTTSSPLIKCEEASRTSNAIKNSLEYSEEQGGWRTTHNQKKADQRLYDVNEHHSRRNYDVGGFIHRQNMNRINRRNIGRSQNGNNVHDSLLDHTPPRLTSRITPEVDLTTITPTADTLTKRQRKRGSTSGNPNEASHNSEIAFLNSSGQSSSSSWNHVSNPEVIELSTPRYTNRPSDDLDDNNNNSSDARAKQVEADEILARELQEQLYHDDFFDGRGIDEHLAWELQHAEDHPDTSIDINHISHPTRLPRANRQPRARPNQNPSNRRRAVSQNHSSSRISQLRSRMVNRSSTPTRSSRGRRSLFPLDMDLDMRLDILEALEDAVGDLNDMGMGDDIFDTQRDFTDADYEMLLALDERNHQHTGATSNQINSLPQSTIQNDNFTEACAVCLETPAKGEIVRHLPCLHKFHKDCIDPWLRRKTSCPVCKSSIT